MFKTFSHVYALLFVNTEQRCVCVCVCGWVGGDMNFTAGNGLRIDSIFLNHTNHTSLEGGLIVYF